MADDDETREEQAAELEALEAIFGDDYCELDETEEGCARFQVEITDERNEDVKLRLVFSHVPKYPRVALRVVAHALSGIAGPKRKELQGHLESIANESIDMPAAYTLCEAARDWLSSYNGSNDHNDDDDDKKDENAGKFETLDSTQKDKVEVISSKAIGTPVTVESFEEWKVKFLLELESVKSKEEIEREEERASKVTGRQFFESKTVVVSAESASFWELEASQVDAEA